MPLASNDASKGHTMDNVQDTKRIVKLIRFALSGAIMGVALSGLFTRWLGYDDAVSKDLVGASFGFLSVMAFKIFHLI